MDIVIAIYLIATALIIQIIQKAEIIEQNKKYYKLEKEIFDWNKIAHENMKVQVYEAVKDYERTKGQIK